MEILPPFDTAIGRVGLSICFDVSDPKMNIILIASLNKWRVVNTIFCSYDSPRSASR